MASEHHLRPDTSTGTLFEVTPASAGWSYLSFSVVRLEPGESYVRRGDDQEVAVVPLEGSATITIGSLTEQVQRSSVFTEMPRIGYAPPSVDLSVTGTSRFEFAVGSAPAEGLLPPKFVEPAEMKSEVRGGGAATRQVNHVLAHPIPAERLILYEVYVPRGGVVGLAAALSRRLRGSPYLEETYYFRLDPDDGWAVHRNYRLDEDFDESFAVASGDLVLVTKGFHSSVAAPGHNMWFLNYLAGEPTGDERATPPFFQPEYAWIDGRWDEGAWTLPVVEP